MEIEQVRGEAFAMPLTNPAFPPGPYRFINREFVIITYRTDRKALERVVPKPLEPIDDLVKYAFIRMPDSTGLRRLHRIGAGHSGGVRESGYNNPQSGALKGVQVLVMGWGECAHVGETRRTHLLEVFRAAEPRLGDGF
jgi:hypothetical protein